MQHRLFCFVLLCFVWGAANDTLCCFQTGAVSSGGHLGMFPAADGDGDCVWPPSGDTKQFLLEVASVGT